MTGLRDNWKRWLARNDALVFPITVALVEVLVVSILGAVVVQKTFIQSHLDFVSSDLTPLPPDGWNLLVAPFQRWDVVWYEFIATRGYTAANQSAAFFPLYPLLMRAFALGSNAVLAAGRLIAIVCVTVAFILFYRITLRLFNKEIARLSLIVWMTFPTAFYLFVPYAEALFVQCAMVCLEGARRTNGSWQDWRGSLRR